MPTIVGGGRNGANDIDDRPPAFCLQVSSVQRIVEIKIMTTSATHPFRVCQTLDDMLKALAVRSIVFCEEQEVPYRLEYGDGDLDAVHIIGMVEEEPAAAARLRFFGQYAKLERIAVRKRYRGQNLGHALVDYMIGLARERGYRKYKLSAQLHLEAFYAAHGFVAMGDYFVDAGIDHSMMMREEVEAS